MALNDVIYNKKVDVAQAMPVPVVFAKQNDNAKRKVVVTLVKNGQPFVLGTGVNGYIQGATAPNPVTKRQVKFKRDLTAIDTTQGTATFIITESMTAEIGITQCEVSIYDTEKPQEILCTANINIEVQGTGMSPQDEMASDDYQAIVSIKAEVTAMRDEVRDKTNQAIAAAETAAQNAYNSALGVQKIVAGNEAYTKDEVDLKFSRAPRKTATGKGEIMLADSDQGKAYVELQGNSEQNTKMSDNLYIKKDADLNHALTWDSGTLIAEQGTIAMPVLQLVSVGKIQSNFNTIVFLYKDSTYVGSLGTNGEVRGPGIVGSDAKMFYITATTLSSANSYRVVCRSSSNSNLDMTNQAVDIRFVLTEDSTVSIPSPRYPSEVQSVGDIPKDSNGVEIRNLLNEEWLRSQPISSWLDGTNNSYYINIGEMIPQEKRKYLGYFVELTNQNTIEGLDSQTYISVSSIGGGNRSMLLVNGNTPQRGSSADLRTYPDLNLVIWKNNSTMTKEEIIHYYLTHFRYMVTYVKDKDIDEYRPYIGYNNGLIKIESQGKNLFPGKGVMIGNIGAGGVPQSNTKVLRTDFIRIDKNKQYTFNPGTYTPYVYLYDDNKGYIDGLDNTRVFNSGNAGYVILQFNSSPPAEQTQANVDIMNKMLQLEEGAQATKYQPYYQQITWIPLREPLRGLPDGRADTIDRDGNVIQYIDCSGVEQYSIAQESAQIFEGNLFKTSFKNGNYVGIAKKDNGVYCNIMKFKQTASLQYGVSASPLYGVIYFNLKGKLSENTVDLARKFLNDNNAVFYFTLRTPITYQIPAIYIETYESVTNVRCLNKIKPSTMGLDYKLAISSLIKRLEALETTAVQEVTRNV